MGNLYDSQAISGYNASPPPDDASQTAANQVNWSKHKTKLGDPLKTLAEGINTAVDNAFGQLPYYTTRSVSSTDSLVAGDDHKIISCTNTFTFTLLPAATAGTAFRVLIKNNGSGTITVEADGSELIDTDLNKTLTANETLELWCTGTGWLDLGAGPATTSIPGFPENMIINGDARVAQQGTTFDSTTDPANNDDTYLFDQIILLSDGNDRVDVTQETSVVPTGVYSAIRAEVETVSGASEKFGFLFPIEARNCRDVIGGTASLSFQARTTSLAVENIRAHILAWDGTEDTITSDVVSAWGLEGANPTFATNWTAENTAANLALTNEYQTFKIENVSIDTSGAVNLAVFIHVDDTDLIANNLLYITDVSLVSGAEAVAPRFRTIQEELALCQRYYYKTFAQGTRPAQNAGFGGAISLTAANNGRFAYALRFPVPMFASPTITSFNPAAANTSWRNSIDNSDTGNATFNTTDSGTQLSQSVLDATDANDQMNIHITAEARL